MAQKEKIVIESLGKKVLVEADQDVIRSIRTSTFAYEHIPCCEITAPGSAVDASVSATRGNFQMDWRFPTASYQNEIIDHRDVVSMCEYFLERLRQEEGLYTIHGNTVDINGKGIVIFGPSHVGKTTVSLLAAKQNGGKVIANERTVIHARNHEAIGSVRNLSLGRHAQEALGDTDITAHIGSGRVHIDFFVHPYPHSGTPETILYRHDQAIWDLTEETDRFIRGLNKQVLKGQAGRHRLASLDTEELANNRYTALSQLLTYVPCYTMKGSHEDIVRLIGEKIYK